MPFTGGDIINNAAIAIEQRVTSRWQQVWTSGHPVLRIIEEKKTNFNTMGLNRLALILPIIGENQTNAAAGVATGSGELVAMTYNISNGLAQFKYYAGHYRANYVLLATDKKALMNGERGNLLEAKANQMLAGIHDVFSSHLSSTTADQADNSRALGLYQVLSTSNTVGTISQTTDPAVAAYVKTSAGTFALDLVDDMLDTLNSKTQGNIARKGKVDVLLCSVYSGNNVYGKVRNSIAPAERFENKDYTVKYGIENFVYRGAMGVIDQRIGSTLSGSIAGLATDTWWVHLEKQPEMHAPVKIPGTDGYEYVGTAFNAVGCHDPGLNGLIRDIS